LYLLRNFHSLSAPESGLPSWILKAAQTHNRHAKLSISAEQRVSEDALANTPLQSLNFLSIQNKISNFRQFFVCLCIKCATTMIFSRENLDVFLHSSEAEIFSTFSHSLSFARLLG
jgi:hypothetical protein